MNYIKQNQEFNAAADPMQMELEALRAELGMARRREDKLLEQLAATEEIARDAYLELAKTRVELKLSNKEKCTDQLTGVLNRRGLEEALEACETGDILLMIDLDKFKFINDTYGHAAGDKALQTIADYLVDKTRDTDTVARLGGDEFVVILRGVGDAMPNIKTMQLRLGLNNGIPFDFEGNKLSTFGSIGSMAIDPALTPEQILQQADHHMYKVKQAKKRVAPISAPAPTV